VTGSGTISFRRPGSALCPNAVVEEINTRAARQVAVLNVLEFIGGFFPLQVVGLRFHSFGNWRQLPATAVESSKKTAAKTAG